MATFTTEQLLSAEKAFLEEVKQRGLIRVGMRMPNPAEVDALDRALDATVTTVCWREDVPPCVKAQFKVVFNDHGACISLAWGIE